MRYRKLSGIIILLSEHEKVGKRACQPFSLKIPLLPDDTIVRQERTINAEA
ncbi:MAG: hypothetical protein ACOYU1_09245 [Bacteroidota bacterium]|jgi:hypothetical protein